jgi:hypothetical protein
MRPQGNGAPSAALISGRCAVTQTNDRRPKAQRLERQTEDEMQQAALGGTRGAPELHDAPMTPQRAKKTSRSNDPGHVA